MSAWRCFVSVTTLINYLVMQLQLHENHKILSMINYVLLCVKLCFWPRHSCSGQLVPCTASFGQLKVCWLKTLFVALNRSCADFVLVFTARWNVCTKLRTDCGIFTILKCFYLLKLDFAMVPNGPTGGDF